MLTKTITDRTYQGRKMQFELKDRSGQAIPKEMLYVQRYAKKCEECSFKILCNGCFNCGACEGWSDQQIRK